MIPKIIHYCWFGRNPLPESAIKCIDSWKKFLPDYEIKEWNEDNFDVNIIPYTKEAYECKKYAFVSDYARFWILYHHGGVYFDTDVEVIKPMDDIIKRGAFMACELHDGTIAPGLGLAACPNMEVYARILNNYKGMKFLNEDGTRNSYSMIPMVTSLFRAEGLGNDDEVQTIMGVKIYPVEYFNPLDSATGKLHVTGNTHTIHWYTASWMDAKTRRIQVLKRLVRRVMGMFTRR